MISKASNLIFCRRKCQFEILTTICLKIKYSQGCFSAFQMNEHQQEVMFKKMGYKSCCFLGILYRYTRIIRRSNNSPVFFFVSFWIGFSKIVYRIFFVSICFLILSFLRDCQYFHKKGQLDIHLRVLVHFHRVVAELHDLVVLGYCSLVVVDID